MKSLIEQMQILPPWNDDVKFENFITSYFNDLEKTLSYDRFGRLGQKQFGLDIYSIEKRTVIQCKLKSIRGGNDEPRSRKRPACDAYKFNLSKYEVFQGYEMQAIIHKLPQAGRLRQHETLQMSEI